MNFSKSPASAMDTEDKCFIICMVVYQWKMWCKMLVCDFSLRRIVLMDLKN